MTDSTQRITDAILAEAAPSSVLTPPERKAVASASAPAKKTPAPAPLPKPGKDAIRFECLLCGSKISVGKEMAGKKMACPSCGEVLTAPSE